MKDWAPDHPKAKLMEKKRAAILDAARTVFLRDGYEGASMESIAVAADVSIMTLYRHSESKDDLFAAVIASACDPSDEAEMDEWMKLMQRPLREVLVTTGVMFQERMGSADTAALLRTVMGEVGRFPHLAETAYRGFIGHGEEMIDGVLGIKDETKAMSKAARHKLAVTFIDQLVGADMLRVLLGMGGVSKGDYRKRAERAAELLIGEMAAEA